MKYIVVNEDGTTRNETWMERAQDAFNDAKWWIKCHKKQIIEAVPFIAFIGGEAVSIVSKLAKAKADTVGNTKKKTVYDPKLDIYWKLKRQMTNSENEELERRMKNGESRGAILRSMNLLK